MGNTTNYSPLIERAVEECLQCLRWCSACGDEGLTHDPSSMATSIRLCHECAPVCGVCAALLSGNSRFGLSVLRCLCGNLRSLRFGVRKTHTRRDDAEVCRGLRSLCHGVPGGCQGWTNSKGRVESCKPWRALTGRLLVRTVPSGMTP